MLVNTVFSLKLCVQHKNTFGKDLVGEWEGKQFIASYDDVGNE